MSLITQTPRRPAVTKFCKDCRFFAATRTNSITASCDHPDCLKWLEDTATLNPVNGELSMAPAHCGYLRALSESPCGPYGRLFEKKETPA